MQERQEASVMAIGVTNDWVTSTRTSKSFMRYGASEASTVYSVSLRLLVVLLSAWVLGAALRLSTELAG